MKNTDPVWRIAARVPFAHADATADALEPFVDAVTWTIDEESDMWTVEGFSAKAPNQELVRQGLKDQGLGMAEVSFEELAPRDWVAENLQDFPPIEIGRFFIHGSHIKVPAPRGRIVLNINPGTAFGTGSHATTAGCLAAISDLHRNVTIKRALDMGCGSGVLGLAVARLFNARVVASDIDPIATRVSRENFQLNKAADQTLALAAPGFAHGDIKRAAPYDLIVANILANPVAKMAPDCRRHLRPGGRVVLSGFITRDERRVLGAYLLQDFKLERRIQIDDWLTLVLKRRHGA